MYFRRNENGDLTNVTVKEAMDVINSCMIGELRKTVRSMSGSRVYYSIMFRDGRKVTYRMIEGEIPEPVKAEVEPDVSTQVKGDTITVSSDGKTAHVVLAKGRTYIVLTWVSRKHPQNEYGVSCIADHTSYWSKRNGESFGATRFTSERDKPGSVGGRIWALLVKAGIA